ncbi:MAG: hypothetical protein ACREIS_05590 [Nitrospiraceae bacterium]
MSDHLPMDVTCSECGNQTVCGECGVCHLCRDRRMEEDTARINHVRARQRLVRGGPERTICGRPVTDLDVRPTDAAGMLGFDEFEQWLRCPDCRRIVENEF